MERKRRKNISLQQEVYTLALCVLAVKMMLDSSALWRRPEWMDSLMLVTYFGLIFVKLCLQEYRWNQLIPIVVVGLCCVYTCFSIQYFTILFTFTMIIGLQHVDLKKTLHTTACLKLSVIALHVAVYIVVYLVAPNTLSFSYRTGGQPRHYFFLGHANTFSAYLVWAMLELLYANYERIRARHVTFVWIVYLIFYQFTDSNTSLIICSLSCLLMIVDKNKPGLLAEPMRILARFTYPLLAIFFTFLSAGYTGFSGGMMEFFNVLNKFFTGRLLYGAFLYDTFGPTLLGQIVYLPGSVVHWYGNWIDNIVIDNCFIMLLEYYGWIYMVFISIAFLWIFQRRTSLGTVEKILIFAYMYFAVMENYATNAVYCFPLLFIGVYVFRDAQSGADKEDKMKRAEKLLKG